jgi:hypothetical protein
MSDGTSKLLGIKASSVTEMKGYPRRKERSEPAGTEEGEEGRR